MYAGGAYSIYDYYHGPYSVTIRAGVTSVPFDIEIFDDDSREENENFNIYIDVESLPYYITRGSIDYAAVTIVDDDCEYSNIRS